MLSLSRTLVLSLHAAPADDRVVGVLVRGRPATGLAHGLDHLDRGRGDGVERVELGHDRAGEQLVVLDLGVAHGEAGLAGVVLELLASDLADGHAAPRVTVSNIDWSVQKRSDPGLSRTLRGS
jgi:hypothetical protein